MVFFSVYNRTMCWIILSVALWAGDPFLLEPGDRETQRWARYLLEDRGADTRDALQNARHYVPQLKVIFRDEGLPEDLVWIALVESGFRRDAVNASGAVGMFQFKIITGRAFGLEIDHSRDQRLDPLAAGRAAARYLRYLRNKFSSWELTLAAYNLGEGDLRRIMQRHHINHWLDVRPLVRPQTQHYLYKVRAAAIIGNDFLNRNPLDLGEGERVYLVRRGDTLYGIAKRFKVSIERLVAHNQLEGHNLRPGRHLVLPPPENR